MHLWLQKHSMKHPRVVVPNPLLSLNFLSIVSNPREALGLAFFLPKIDFLKV
jgi:hypothetical protein